MAELTIERLEDVVAALSSTLKAFEGREVWWRGHAMFDWTLKPGVLRDYPLGFESNFNFRFRVRAQARHPKCPSKNEIVEWLLLAQHYGLPTRLLDWSESILVALYFVVANDSHGAEDGALFGLSPTLLSTRERDKEAIALSEDPEVQKLARDAFSTDKVRSNRILPFVPDQFDARHIAQATTMTIHGRSDDLYKEPFTNECIVRFRVLSSSKPAIRTLLFSMGIRQSNLFPDLANLSEELKHLNFARPAEQNGEGDK